MANRWQRGLIAEPRGSESVQSFQVIIQYAMKNHSLCEQYSQNRPRPPAQWHMIIPSGSEVKRAIWACGQMKLHLEVPALSWNRKSIMLSQLPSGSLSSKGVQCHQINPFCNLEKDGYGFRQRKWHNVAKMGFHVVLCWWLDPAN